MLNAPADTRTRLLDAAIQLVRQKGYAATSVDNLCEVASVTKGAFFHHFASKEALAVAAVERWVTRTRGFFAGAEYRHLDDPLDRVLAYVRLRRDMVQGDFPEFTCFAGTLVQETFGSHDAIRDACGDSITSHAATLIADLEAARQQRVPDATWSAASLALHTQAVIQGAFVVAKATHDPRHAVESIEHLEHYLRLLFNRPPTREET